MSCSPCPLAGCFTDAGSNSDRLWLKTECKGLQQKLQLYIHRLAMTERDAERRRELLAVAHEETAGKALTSASLA